MTGVALVILAALGVAGVYAYTRKDSFDLGPRGHFSGILTKGRWYRVTGIVPKAWAESVYKSVPQGQGQKALEAAVAQETEKAGFDRVKLATEDPTAEHTWSVIAQWSLSSSEAFDTPHFHMLRLQEVETPPEFEASTDEHLDTGLTEDEAHAIRFALLKDPDPRRLSGFASTFEVDYPISQGLLLAKSRRQAAARTLNVSGRRIPDAMGGNPYLGARAARRSLAKHLAGQQVRVGPHKRGLPIYGPFRGRIAGTYAATRAPDNRWNSWPDNVRSVLPYEMSGDYVTAFGVPWQPGGFAQTGIDHTQPFAGYGSLLAYNVMKLQNCGLNRVLANDCAGESFAEAAQVDWDFMGEQMKKSGVELARIIAAVAPFIGIIPGLGQGIAAMLMAASALAMGQPLDDAVLNVVSNAIPGGALAKAAFDTAAVAARGILDGQPLDAVALDTARRAAVEVGGPMAGAAFDAGVAIARGRDLQEAGFPALAQIAFGSDIMEKAASFSETALEAVRKGVSIKTMLVDQLVDAISAFDGDFVRQELPGLVSRIVSNPDLASLMPDELAKKLGIPTNLAWAALASVRDDHSGGVVVDESVLKRLLNIPAYAHYYTGSVFEQQNKAAMVYAAQQKEHEQLVKGLTTSNAAFQLAFAAQRPQLSNVQKPGDVASNVKAINQAAQSGDPNAQAARIQLDKARRALDRLNWVEWYKRIEEAGAL